MQVIMKDFEKKFIIVFKWLLISLPLFFLLVCYFGNVLMTGFSLKSNTPYETAEDYYFNTNPFGDGDIANVSDSISYYFSGVNALMSGITGPFYELHNLFSEDLGFYNQANPYFLFASHYLDYVLYIELFFLAYHLFRYFIYFGVNLFERKRNL